MSHIQVAIDRHSRSREPAAVDNGGMIEFVAEDGDVRCTEGRHQPQVRAESRRKQQRALDLVMTCEGLLQFDMN